MKLDCLVGVGLITFVSSSVFGEKPPPIKAEAAGLRIISKQYGEDFSGIRPFNYFLGTDLAVLITMEQGGIVQLNENGSKVKSFTDDKGTDLLKDRPGSFSQAGIGPFSDLSDDGKALLATITGPNPPVAGANRIKAVGVFSILIATEKETIKSTPTLLKKGEILKVGDTDFKVTSIKEDKYNEGETTISLEIKRDIPEVIEFRFATPDGKAVETSRNGSTRMGSGNQVTLQIDLNIKGALEKGILELDRWKDIKEEIVPFDFNVGIGL